MTMNNKQLLRKVVEIPVPSHQTFDTRKECHAGYEGKGKKELKVTWFQPLLKEHYLGLEFVFDADLKKKVNRELPTWLVELNVPKKTIVIAKLLGKRATQRSLPPLTMAEETDTSSTSPITSIS